MKSRREILSGWSTVLGLLLLVVVGILAYRSAHRLTISEKWVSHTAEVISDLRRVSSDLIEAENSQRGYALFRDESELTHSHELSVRILPEIAEIRRLTSDNRRQQARLDRLDVVVRQRLALLQDELSLAGGDPAHVAIHGHSENVSSDCRQLLVEIENEERLLLGDREQWAVADTRITRLFGVGGFFLAVLLVAAAGVLGRWEIVRRHQTEDALQVTHDRIASNLIDAEDRAREGSVLSELAARLQSCRNLAEALPFISRGMEQLFPEESGSIFLTSASRNILESASNWGQHVATESFFSPDDCWALRYGRLVVVDATDAVLRCTHLHPDAGPDALCLPLVGQGETLGLICITTHLPPLSYLRCGQKAFRKIVFEKPR